MMHRLCLPTPAAISVLMEYQPIVEIGSGDGLWQVIMRHCGIECRGFDKRNGVTHVEAAMHEGALLAVWPPDGDEVSKWIKAREWKAVLIAANWMRISVGDALSSYRCIKEIILPEGYKGGSILKAFERTRNGTLTKT